MEFLGPGSDPFLPLFRYVFSIDEFNSGKENSLLMVVSHTYH